jgi:hypothetical protein
MGTRLPSRTGDHQSVPVGIDDHEDPHAPWHVRRLLLEVGRGALHAILGGANVSSRDVGW